MARDNRIYVSKPKPHGNRWRVTVTEVTYDKQGERESKSRRVSFSGETAEQDAVDYRRDLLAEQGQETVSVLLDRFIDEVLPRRGARASSQATMRTSIGRLVARLPEMLDEVTPSAAERAYRELATTCKPDTHQNSLRDARTMWRALKMAENPWLDIEPIGQRRRGKPRLTIDESRRFLTACLEDGRPGALAAAVCLTLAIRVSEVVALTGRDIDDGGRVVWIQRGKTENAKRTIEIPEVMQRPLLDCAARAGSGLLFPRRRAWVGRWVAQMCDVAGVPRVCPHGLRATHATIAAGAGVTAHVVAGTLGHGGTRVTRDHYIAPGVEDSAAARSVGERLGVQMVGSPPSAQDDDARLRN